MRGRLTFNTIPIKLRFAIEYEVRGGGFRRMKCFLTKGLYFLNISFAICWPLFITGRMWHAQFATPCFPRNLKLVYCYNIIPPIHQPDIWTRDNFVSCCYFKILRCYDEYYLLGEWRICHISGFCASRLIDWTRHFTGSAYVDICNVLIWSEKKIIPLEQPWYLS